MGFIVLNMGLQGFHFIMGFYGLYCQVFVWKYSYNILVQIRDSLDNDDFCHITLDTLALKCGRRNLE